MRLTCPNPPYDASSLPTPSTGAVNSKRAQARPQHGLVAGHHGTADMPFKSIDDGEGLHIGREQTDRINASRVETRAALVQSGESPRTAETA